MAQTAPNTRVKGLRTARTERGREADRKVGTRMLQSGAARGLPVPRTHRACAVRPPPTHRAAQGSSQGGLGAGKDTIRLRERMWGRGARRARVATQPLPALHAGMGSRRWHKSVAAHAPGVPCRARRTQPATCCRSGNHCMLQRGEKGKLLWLAGRKCVMQRVLLFCVHEGEWHTPRRRARHAGSHARSRLAKRSSKAR